MNHPFSPHQIRYLNKNQNLNFEMGGGLQKNKARLSYQYVTE